MAKKAQWRKRTQLHLVRSNAETDGNVLYGYPEELKLLVTTGRDVGEASKVSRGLSQSGVDVATEKTELTAREMLAPARHGGTEVLTK
ncbi:Cysteine--tRNA ligase [Trichinella spiralis]|uniref:Cysteine--tRNA ligase n=1 Tax=Trichinella spiralis TaxID=6334 RepID=A0ABR3KG07_TRISP